MCESKKCVLSFDIGHSSIGWAVLTSEKSSKGTPFPTPSIEGCGSVIFPKDDCLASSRRDHRRTRRNIRSTRQRITRLKDLLAHLSVLSPTDLDNGGHPAPHMLAAKSLISDAPTLSWLELWHVLRWYAHNRGYDGNSRWARHDNDSGGDTEKEKTALELMAKHGTNSMAETVCSELGIDLNSNKISSNNPFKTLNAAFPRSIVRNEVLEILYKHKGHLDKLDDDFITTLIASEGSQEKRAWETIPVPSIKLPKRYFGGLLFGQLIPRFDNRIIAKCPISREKVPNKISKEFRYFRWAMLLANIKVEGKSLTAEQRQAVHAFMEEKGKLTPTELKSFVEKLTGSKNSNIHASFEIHPDSKDALVLDPALAYFNSGDSSPRKNTITLAHFWRHLSEHTKQKALGRWKKGRPVTLQWMLDQCAKESVDASPLNSEIEQHVQTDQKKKKPSYLTREHFLRKRFAPSNALSGRAVYSRRVMQEIFDFVLSTDRHPTEKETATLPAGPIYRSKDILKAERDRPIEELTNNHLIRQRLTILLRLVDDIIENYCDGDAKIVSDIVVEVARDLQEYSSMTADKMAGELTKRLSHFKSAVKYLEENAPDLSVTGSLIRKCRLAMDMDWRCPFTGKKYDALDLPQLEREHIIPYADRPTNSL
ncbi:MAG: type II CRISPR RNA-guided endonuclease Cas9, partial [Rubritalea sp.]|uniref:type II CRISPR RNA-guided endonuclease Cas9 n=1 Tax=Rubritalea sp. TaxID=2109375 RepID=UPI003241BD0A